MVAVTVVLTAVLGGVVFTLEPAADEPARAGVSFSEGPADGQVDVTAITVANADQLTILNDGVQVATLSTAGERATVIATGPVTVVGVLNGKQTVLQSFTPDTTVESVSGTVQVNPTIEGATVTAVQADGTSLARTKTAADGTYDLGVAPSQFEDVLVTVNGTTELSNPLYTSTLEPADSATITTDFDETTLFNTTINGTDVSIIYATTAEGANRVGTFQQLQAMRNAPNAEYTLITDIEASETQQNFDGGAGFTPIGNSTTGFGGSLDGQGNTIAGLSIDRSGGETGLFGQTLQSSVVQNLTLVNTTVNGGSSSGGLIGANRGTVSNVTVSSTVTGDIDVGGLIGRNDGSVTEVTARSDATGDVAVGGLMGSNAGTVSDATASGNVTGGQFGSLGGLIGENSGPLLNASASGTVTGSEEAGGLVGLNRATVSDVTASTDVESTSGTVGGLIAQNTGSIESATASGSVTGTESVGGLVGFSDGGSRANSYWLNTDTDDDATGEVNNGDATGVETAAPSGGDFTLIEARGRSAESKMTLDFKSTWKTVAGEFPTLRTRN